MPHWPAAIACALLLLAVLPGTTLGHAELVETSPQDGAVIAETPVEVTATFSEPLVVESSAITLRTASGDAVAEGTASGREPEILRVAPPPTLAPGEYEVRWVAASDDGHIERGSFTFTIATPSPSPSPPPASPSPPPSPSEAASPSAAASPSPSAAPVPPDSAAASAAGPIVAALVLLALIGLWLMRRRRP